MTNTQPAQLGSRRATSLLHRLFMRSWPTIATLAALRSVWFLAFPAAVLSVGTRMPPWAPLAAGAIFDLCGLLIQQRLRRTLRVACMMDAAQDALEKSGGVPESSTDAAFWSAWLAEYGISQDVPSILAASLGTLAILAVAAVRLGAGLVVPVLAVVAVTTMLGVVAHRRLRPWIERVVETRRVAATWMAAAERDAGEIGGTTSSRSFLDNVSASTHDWCTAEDRSERRQLALRASVLALLAVGLVTALFVSGIDWLSVALADSGLRVSVREVSDVVLMASSIPVVLVAARHLNSLLTAHAELKQLRPLLRGGQPDDRKRWTEPPREIVIRNLEVHLEGHLALKIPNLTLSLELPIAISGPNGSGKTTFASVLTGVLAPSRGEVTVGGVPTTRIDRDAVAYVPQDPVLIESLTVAESVRLVAPVASDDAIRAMLTELALDKPLGHKTGELSRGERRRIAIARALLKEPMLLVLDEPDTWLDVDGRAVLASVLERESSKRAIVIVSHRPDLFELAGTVVRLTAEHEVG